MGRKEKTERHPPRGRRGCSGGGVADRVGSLEAGKDADIVLWDGDPMVSDTRVKMVMVDGKILVDGFRGA